MSQEPLDEPEQPLVVAPPGEAHGLVRHIKRQSIRMLNITDSELRLYVSFAKRSADAQGFCMSAASLLISVFVTLVTTEIARPILVPLLVLMAFLTLFFAKSWYRESIAASDELKKLMNDIYPSDTQSK